MIQQIKEPRPFNWDSRLGEDERDGIASLNTSLARLSSIRAVQINRTGHFAKSKIAWKLASYQHSLLHRIVDLFDGAAVAWNNDCILTSMLSARAFMETFALMADFEQTVERHLKNENLLALDALAQAGLFATRDTELLKDYPATQATNALTYIDKVDKQIFGFRSLYDGLSESCHPNSRGHYFMFSTLDRTNGTVDFATGKRATQNGNGILAALTTLPLVEFHMTHLDTMIEDVARLQERITPVRRE